MVTRTASCSCGQLRIEVQGEPAGIGICHCLACQRRTGSVFAALASFRAPYRVIGTASAYIRAGDQGARFKFRFCPVCGTNLYHTELFRGADGEDVEESTGVGVAIGGFGDPDFPPPQVSIYDCRRHGWVKLPDGITAYEKDPT